MCTFSQNVVMSRDSDFWQAEARYGVGVALKSFLIHSSTFVPNFTISSHFEQFPQIFMLNRWTIVNSLKNVLLRMGFSVQNYRGQFYDGLNNMVGCKSGVATQIQKRNPVPSLLTVMDTLYS